MEFLAIMKLVPTVLAVVETFKRFISKKTRKVVNPIIAAVTGLVGAYMVGGTEEIATVLLTGIAAAVGAVGTYKIPKEVSRKLGIESQKN